jgi:hypothetical protein
MVLDCVLVLFYIGLLSVVQEVFMNARVKTVTAAPAHEAVDRDNDLVVVAVLKERIWLDENRKGWLRRVIAERANKDLPPQPEAASERNEITEGIESGRHESY